MLPQTRADLDDFFGLLAGRGKSRKWILRTLRGRARDIKCLNWSGTETHFHYIQIVSRVTLTDHSEIEVFADRARVSRLCILRQEHPRAHSPLNGAKSSTGDGNGRFVYNTQLWQQQLAINNKQEADNYTCLEEAKVSEKRLNPAKAAEHGEKDFACPLCLVSIKPEYLPIGQTLNGSRLF